MKRIVFDAEANGWANEADTIWCICTRDLATREERSFGPDEIEEGLRFLMDADVVIGHHILGYDLYLFQRLFPWFRPKAYEDTLVLSQLYNSDRPGGHSIKAWGKRVGIVKPEHDDFTQYTPEMLVRCQEDTRINAALIPYLIAEMGEEDWSAAIELEYKCRILQTEQEMRGVAFDRELAEKNFAEFKAIQDGLLEDMKPLLPMKMKYGTTYNAPFTKAGKLNHHVAKFIPEELHHQIAGPFTGIIWEEFNLNSPQQVNQLLLDNGWKPTEFNYVKKKGGGFELNGDGSYKVSTPKIEKSMESLETVTGPVGRLIADERVVRSRMGNIHRIRKKDNTAQGWLNIIRPDGRIEAGAFPMGTPTSRYRHYNIVNVPRPTTLYGDKLRELFTATEGYRLVGSDGAGLEARVAGHYTAELDGGVFAKELLEGDIHQKNADYFTEAIGMLVTRSDSKNVYYALLYGATPRKIASMLGISLEVATTLVEAFWEALPALAGVSDRVKKEARKQGYLIGLDGRRIPVRSAHAALNCLFQSAGAIIMKYAFTEIFLNQVDTPLDYWKDDELPWRCVMTMHDEAQADVLEENVEAHKAAWVAMGHQVTKHFNMQIPIEFESIVGNNWKETH